MAHVVRQLLFGTILLIPLLGGCSRSAGDPSRDSDASDYGAREQGQAGVQQPETRSPVVANDPAVSWERLAQSLAAGDVEGVSSAIPNRYRSGFARWWHASVEPIDSKARGEFAASIATFAETLGGKGDFLLASDRIELNGTAAAFARQHFPDVARVVAATARWPGWSDDDPDATLDGLVEHLVRAIASEAEIATALRQMRFETVSADGDSAVVGLRLANDSRRFDVPAMKINGDWFPKALVERWTDQEAATPSMTPMEAASLSESLRQRAGQWRELAAALESISTQADFDAHVDHAAALVMAAAAPTTAAPRAVGVDERVTLLLQGAFTDDAKDRVLWDLVSRTDAPASGVAEAIDTEDGLQITVGPVADLAAFAKRLPHIAVEHIDPANRTITARLAKP